MNDWADPERIRSNIGLDPALATPADVYMSLRWHIWLPSQVGSLMGGLPGPAANDVETWRGMLNDASTPLMHRMRTIDAQLYMPGAVLAKVDRMSMQHALEVRCPLLDRDFAELAMGIREDDCWIAPDVTKSILKEIALDYLPREWMYRPKKGFGLPANAWGMGNVVQLCRELLTGPESQLARHLDRAQLEQTVDNQSRQGNFSIYQMWPLLIMELWLRDQPSKMARAGEPFRAAA
jgi:asparagine synthase (glutamine-hydrolysing)